MKIIYLDKPSYFPQGGVDRLKSLGEVVIYNDKPDENEAIRRLSDTDIAIVEWTEISAEMFDKITRLKYIVLVTTGYSFVDVAAARRNGIIVSNTPHYSRQSVAEHIFAMFLSLSKRLCKADQLVRAGKHSYTDHILGVELYGKTLGILGLGSIGSWVAKIGLGFGMHVVGYNRSKKDIPDVSQLSLEEVLRTSDFLAICLSINPSSKGILNEKMLHLVKPSAILVNIAGNELVNESVILDMLTTKRLQGAGFEEFSDERFIELDNVILSPGTAWYTQSSIDRNVEMFVDSVFAFVNGQPRYVVN